jgi:hypothetical protein
MCLVPTGTTLSWRDTATPGGTDVDAMKLQLSIAVMANAAMPQVTAFTLLSIAFMVVSHLLAERLHAVRLCVIYNYITT